MSRRAACASNRDDLGAAEMALCCLDASPTDRPPNAGTADNFNGGDVRGSRLVASAPRTCCLDRYRQMVAATAPGSDCCRDR